jgi:Na+/H+ antiporter NhaD/arsenite permease-like protein
MSSTEVLPASSSLEPADHSGARETFIWLCGAAAIGSVFHLAGWADVSKVIAHFPWQVLAMYLGLELYATMLREAGLLDWLAARVAMLTRAERPRVIIGFAAMLMIVGLVNNNLTTLIVAFPILLPLLRAMNVSQRSLTLLLSMLLAVGNCAGAATPIGDFPAIMIMSSGLVTFAQYLLYCFPLFALTAAVLATIYRRLDGRHGDVVELGHRGLVAQIVARRHEHYRVNIQGLKWLGGVFALMVVAWLVIPIAVVPPVAIAWGGLAMAGFGADRAGMRSPLSNVDVTPMLRMIAVFFAASVIGASPLIDGMARVFSALDVGVPLLLLLIMVLTTVLCALIDAGGAAAALLPLLVKLAADGAPLANYRPIAVVAFASAICAGSSLFLTSATAGQLMAAKVQSAELVDASDRRLVFGFRQYLPYGGMNCGVQLLLAFGWVYLLLVLA